MPEVANLFGPQNDSRLQRADKLSLPFIGTLTMRLGHQALGLVPDRVMRPKYDPGEQSVGIVHFVVGAAHRADLAWYTDAAMNAGERDWAITEISLDCPQIVRNLKRQDGLFTLAERYNDSSSLHLVASIANSLFASEEQAAVISAIASSLTHIVALSLTRADYCQNEFGSLDFNKAHTLSFYFFLTQAMLKRQRNGLPGLTVLSCDGPAIDGHGLRRLILQYLERHEPDLCSWFDENCSCASSISDRIVTKPTTSHRAMIAKGLGGVTDDACLMAEPLNSWLIEGRFAGPRPKWEAVGTRIVQAPSPEDLFRFRTMKRARALLAYCGLGVGYQYLHEAVADRELRALVYQLFLGEALAHSGGPLRVDAKGLAKAQIGRFANTALEIELSRIAEDEVQSTVTDWFEPLAAMQQASSQCSAALATMAAWLGYVNATKTFMRKSLIAKVSSLLKASLGDEESTGSS